MAKGLAESHVLVFGRLIDVVNGGYEMKTLADYEYYRTELGVLYCGFTLTLCQSMV